MERHVRRLSVSARQFQQRRGQPHSEPGTPFVGVIPPRALGDSVFPSNGNLVVPLIDGAIAFPAMMEAIRGARRQIHAVFYIWQDDVIGRQMRALLAEKAREGVTVRLLVDAWGTPGFTKRFSTPLRQAGVRIAAFMPSRR